MVFIYMRRPRHPSQGRARARAPSKCSNYVYHKNIRKNRLTAELSNFLQVWFRAVSIRN